MSDAKKGRWGKWTGGRTSVVDGETVYWIRKTVHGRAYLVPLYGLTEAQAEVELRRFLSDPEGFKTKEMVAKERVAARQEDKAKAVVLTDVLIGEFITFQQQQGRDAKYAANLRTYLRYWAEKLYGRDLRKVSSERLVEVLDSAVTARPKLSVAIKTFGSWAREKRSPRLLTVQNDPTLGFRTIQGGSRKATRGVEGERTHLN